MAIDVDSVCLSWAGQLEAYDNPTSLFSNSSRPRSDSDVIAGARVPILSEHPDPRSFHDAANLWRPENSSTRSTQTGESFHLDSLLFTSARSDHQHPFKVFGKIMQPPTGILMASIKKWQLLQQYLVNLASHNDAVMSALLGLDKLLEGDSVSGSTTSSGGLQDHIQNSFKTTICIIEQDVSLPRFGSSSRMDDLLAAIFILAWIQLLRDRVEHDEESIFPSELADTIITNPYDWNWYSRQLLLWFSFFDSKVSHLGGPTVLTSNAFRVVSQYPIQIISCEFKEFRYRGGSLRDDKGSQLLSRSTLSETSEHRGGNIVSPGRSPCDIKETVLQAILQPAIEWHIKTQAYCHQINALDKHHHKRFTPYTEMKVALKGEQIQSKL
ncbi:hypothetical protein ACHAQD_012283 [Fusarium lateritium]